MHRKTFAAHSRISVGNRCHARCAGAFAAACTSSGTSSTGVPSARWSNSRLCEGKCGRSCGRSWPQIDARQICRQRARRQILGGRYGNQRNRDLTKRCSPATVAIVIRRAASSLILVLILLTVLGHVCEWPGVSFEAAHAHNGHGDEASHHEGDEAQLACDEMLAVRSIAHTTPELGRDAHPSLHPTPALVPMRHVASDLSQPESRHRRLPLFLLHAALLI
jgi:hypothetical protein